MQKEGLDKIVLEKLQLDYRPAHMEDWERMVHRIKNPETKVKIAVVGKYVELPDAYISVTEALHHAGIANSTEVKIKWVNSEQLEGDDCGFSRCFRRLQRYPRSGRLRRPAVWKAKFPR